FTKLALASLYQNKQYSQNILSANYLEQMMLPAPSSNGSYGLGYQVVSMPKRSMVLYGHGGANSGWQALFMVNPATNDGFIMFTNGGSGGKVFGQIICEWMN